MHGFRILIAGSAAFGSDHVDFFKTLLDWKNFVKNSILEPVNS